MFCGSVTITLYGNDLQGWIHEFLIGGRGPSFGSERTVKLFCGKLLLTETTTCFSICEHRSPLVREILLCKHRQTDHRRVPKNNNILHFLITLEFSLVANCNACFIKKISQLKSDIQPCSLKQASVLIGGSGARDPPVGSATDIQCQENAFFLMGSKSSFLSESHL